MSRLTRDGTAEPVSRDQILRHARGHGNIIFPVQLTTSRIGNLTRLIHTLLYVMTIHTYIYLTFKFSFIFPFVSPQPKGTRTNSNTATRSPYKIYLDIGTRVPLQSQTLHTCPYIWRLWGSRSDMSHTTYILFYLFFVWLYCLL